MTVRQFYEKCKISSNDAFESFKNLLDDLENPVKSESTRSFLAQILGYYDQIQDDQFSSDYHFTFIKVDISNKKDFSEPLVLLQFPSTFTPEEWSYTFFEGLSRYNHSEFNDKKLVELGCGNGWITIGLAKKYYPEKIYGLDINPRAIISSKINLYINSIDEKGNIIIDNEGKSLLDRVAFAESDLLGYFKDKNSIFDTIIGCIPQVLSPSEDLFDNIIENQNDEMLYSLSNYCGKQGYIEDQFGLGLIARSVEESLDLLKPNGKIILNLGGRPGEQVLERLFERRGLSVKKIWQRRVIQAGDTDIDPLVEIENKSLHRFEFFIGLNSSEAISAKTAKHYLQEGGQISHALTVYEFTINQHHELRNIFNLLKDPDYKGSLSGLDLAYERKNEAEEKINFLSHLSESLESTNFFPYADTEGEVGFRKRLSQYFNSYFHTQLSERHFVISPSRLSTINNLLQVYQPEKIIVDKTFSQLAAVGGTADRINIIESPTSSNELCALIEKIKPEIVIIAINENQVSQVDSFKAILSTCESVKARLIVDISPYFELSSNPNKIGVLSYAAEHGLPGFCSVICGLTLNQVYSDLELCMFISEDKDILSYLSFSAEFTYSRTPILTQQYYSGLLYELLKFQMTNVREVNLSEIQSADTSSFIQPKKHVLEAFSHPSIKGNTLPINSQSVRLDYGENELPSSKDVKVSIFESFVRQNLGGEEIDPTEELRDIIGRRFGLDRSIQLSYGNGVAPLFAAIVKACKAENGTLFFPEGAYGYFFATAKFYDVDVKLIPTNYENGFKVAPQMLEEALKNAKNPYLFLNFPLVNPTGALYNQEETDALFELLSKSNCNVIIDTVFSGLEFNGVQNADLSKYVQNGLKYALIGGISKEFSAGGLRFGYATTNMPNLRNALQNYVIDQPHKTITYAVKRLYSLLVKEDAQMMADLGNQQATLKKRFEILNKLLNELGWKLLSPQGGLFLVGSPAKYFGKTLLFNGEEQEITASNINEALFEKVNLLINNDVWTGIPGYCRFVLSVEDHVFEEALIKLRQFDGLI